MNHHLFSARKPFRTSILSALFILVPLISQAQRADFMEACAAMEMVVRSNGYTIVDAGYVDAVGNWAGEITSGEITVNTGEHYSIVMLVDQCGYGCNPYVVWQEWGERYEIASETHQESDYKWVITVVNDDDWTTGELLGGVDSETAYSAYMIVGRGTDAMRQKGGGGDFTDTWAAIGSLCCSCLGILFLLTLL
jgi:hypothetical protein